METLIKSIADENGNITEMKITDNDDHLASCLASLSRNNTFVPGISRVIYNDPVTKVWFKDGTSVTIKTSKGDVFSKEIGLCYAIIKRILGVPDEKGEIMSHGYMNRLKKICDSAYDQKKAKKDKPDTSTEIDEHAEYDADPVAFCAKHAPIGPEDRPDQIRAERKRMKREQMEKARSDKATGKKPSLAKTVEDLSKTVKSLESLVASLAPKQ